MIYIHDFSGKEIAIYNSNAIDQWNVFGADNVGKISSDGGKFFYLKDHLGTIRCVLDTNNAAVSGNDLDAWGYPLQGRAYDADVNVNQKYKFTSKERDLESALDFTTGYDYFGARYYNSRIGRWNGVEPLQDKFPDIAPYGYVFNNPIRLFDFDGRGPGPLTAAPTWKDGGGGDGAVGSAIGAGLALAAGKIMQQIGIGLYSLIKPMDIISIISGTFDIIQETISTYITSVNNTKKDQVVGKMRPIQEHLDLLEGNTSKYPGPPYKQDKDKWKTDIKRNWEQAKEIAKKN